LIKQWPVIQLPPIGFQIGIEPHLKPAASALAEESYTTPKASSNQQATGYWSLVTVELLNHSTKSWELLEFSLIKNYNSYCDPVLPPSVFPNPELAPLTF